MRCSFKKAVVATTTVSLLAGIGASAALADRPDTTPTTICHHPDTDHEKTMTVPWVAWEKGHSKHGDTLGPCEGGEDPGGEDPGGEDPDGKCEAVLGHLTAILPGEVDALLDLAAYASVDELLEALALLEVNAGIDLDAILVEITDGVCDLVDLVLHIKHKVVGVALFATGGVLHLAGHVTHKALHVVGDVVDGASAHVVAGVLVDVDAAVYGIFGIDADLVGGAFLGLL